MAGLGGTPIRPAHGHQRGHVFCYYCYMLVCEMGSYEGEQEDTTR